MEWIDHLLTPFFGKKLGILGNDCVGKTRLIQYIYDKKLIECPDSTRPFTKMEAKVFQFSDKKIRLKLTIDTGGARDWLPNKRETFTQSDWVFYVVRSDWIFSIDNYHQEEDIKSNKFVIRNDFQHMRAWSQNKSPSLILIVGNYFNNLSSNEQIIHTFSTNKNKNKYLRNFTNHLHKTCGHLDISTNIKYVVGSLYSEDSAKILVKDIFNSII